MSSPTVPAMAPERGTLVLLAFACNAQEGSEPGAGWTTLAAASRVFSKIVLLTRAEKLPFLFADLQGLSADVEVVAVHTPFDRFGNIYLRYSAWVIGAARALRARLRRDCSVTVVHHVTYASDWMPSPLALLPRKTLDGQRVVWGPVGGATYPPREILRLFPRSFRVKELIREKTTSAIRALTLPLHRRVVDVAVALNPDSAAAFQGFPRVDISANIALEVTPPPPPKRLGREEVVVFAGRPLEWKGVRLLLEAQRMPSSRWALELFGGTTAEFAEFGDVAAPGVSVMGRVHRADLLKRLGEVSVLALPSLHDSAGWVAAEAAAMGTSVVCLDLGGVSTMAGSHAQVVPALPAADLAKRLAQAIEEVLQETPTAAAPEESWSMSAYEQRLRSWYGAS